jgi:antitoxin component HigA of HigAB toxin-antitoxin module
MIPKTIKTEKEYDRALARINILMDADPGTPRGDELELLVTLVQAYEKVKYPIDPPDPEVDRIWAEEARKRWTAYKAGHIPSVSYQEVMDKYRHS